MARIGEIAAGRARQFRAIMPWLAAAALLCVPFLAMQVTGEVAWGPGDFAFAALLLAALVAGAQLIGQHLQGRRRYAAIAALLAMVGFVWVDLAVGILGIPGISGS